MERADEIIDFWVNEVGPDGWYIADENVDAQIKERFMADYDLAASGKLEEWEKTATGTLAIIILLDQFARNMFRGRPESFDADPLARDVAGRAIRKDFDQEIDEPLRQFFYMPFMHSENLGDQTIAVKLFKKRTSDVGNNQIHAQAHREIIHKFGRFPFRNNALGRESTAEETAFMDKGGYRAIVEKLTAESSE
ncbi:hypothetical protein GCM10008927_02070 [Amylibacter ulvae]|uniref:DUF924 domain-containing protein n=1 Tax=Paramylibacter ulvae TaxID=1651968 RepID=A0ABQ3CSV0_9RHOB|nr:DUF924 family protein [Amylibacter ulvae]GHA41318.1 hypothetical protein GCM10008927_02070 [Amylibacter ulvae]